MCSSWLLQHGLPDRVHSASRAIRDRPVWRPRRTRRRLQVSPRLGLPPHSIPPPVHPKAQMAHLCCAVLDLAGHAHGPGCGHSAFEHEGHVDYLVRRLVVVCSAVGWPRRRRLTAAAPPPPHRRWPLPLAAHGPYPPGLRSPLPQVGDELHHVSDSCCVNNCHRGPVVVSHGRLSTLLHRCAAARERLGRAGRTLHVPPAFQASALPPAAVG